MEGQLRSEAEKSWLPGSPVGDRPLSRRAYDAIFTAIQDGQLAPGSLVREADLTTWLEMSRTPLRDALQRLAAEGLLSMQSHRGIQIAALDQQQVSELYTAREWAEGAAASLAARYATPVDIARMRHILEQERASAADPVAGARLNRDLHLTIHTCARNRYLAEHLSSMAALLALVGNTRRRNANRVLEAEQEHTALVAAIADGDSQRAEASARQHIQAAQRNVLTHWVGA